MRVRRAELINKKNILFLLLFFYVNFPFSFSSIHLIQDLAVLGMSFIVIVSNLKLVLEKFKILNPTVLFSFLIFGLLTIF